MLYIFRELFLLIAKFLDVLRLESFFSGSHRGLFKLFPATQLLYQLRVIHLALELLQGPVDFVSFIYNYS